MLELERMEPLRVIGALKYQSAIKVVKARQIKTNQFELLFASLALPPHDFFIRRSSPSAVTMCHQNEAIDDVEKIGNSNHEFELREGTTRSRVNRTQSALQESAPEFLRSQVIFKFSAVASRLMT